MLKDLALFLLTPPGIGVWLCIVALYMGVKSKKSMWRWVVVATVLGWGLATPAMGRVLSTMLISQVVSPKHILPQEADLIVVLAGGMEYTGGTGWLPTKASYQRAMVAYQVQERISSRIPIVISGGKTQGVQYPSEAAVINNLVTTKAQITPTILEETALNTFESAQEVARIAQTRNASTLLLVTSDIHMLRALAAFRARGLDPAPIPVFTINRGALAFADFLPSVKGAYEVHQALYEVLGLIYYKLAGYIKVSDIFYD